MTMLLMVMAIGAISMTYAATTFIGEDCAAQYDPEMGAGKACNDLNNLNDRVTALENPVIGVWTTINPTPQLYDVKWDGEILNTSPTHLQFVPGTENDRGHHIEIMQDGIYEITVNMSLQSNSGSPQLTWILYQDTTSNRLCDISIPPNGGGEIIQNTCTTIGEFEAGDKILVLNSGAPVDNKIDRTFITIQKLG